MSNSTDTLAVHGGKPIIPSAFKRFNTIGTEEKAAVAKVLDSGILSAYMGAPGDAFMGGVTVRRFEREAAEYFGVRHAIAVNSWTSGLIAAVGALDIEPGDEIITTPWTMVATATSILMWNAIPVFADIDPLTFNIDPKCVEKLITPKTKAVMAADIFGHSCDLVALRKICDANRLKLITDTAQAPGARHANRLVGTSADIGGFSLNYHKHIHCGEGGVLVTDDDRLARRLALIRNHGEAVIDTREPAELANILGYNFRMGEIEAAIASEQLRKLQANVASRQAAADRLRRGLQCLEGLRMPHVAEGSTHVYYIFGMVLEASRVGASRASISAALRAEGVPSLLSAYQNVHRYPIFEERIAYGRHGFPWTLPGRESSVQYGAGLCPVAEQLHEQTFMGLNLCLYEYTDAEVDAVVAAFHKVWAHRSSLS